jgi:hypothetical protein
MVVGLIDLFCFKSISIYEQPYHGVVEFFGFREADRFSRQAFDPRA